MLGKFRMGEVFPPSSDLAAWIVTVAMISNDVVFASRSFEGILSDDLPTIKGERLYWFRLISSHYREAVKYLWCTRSKPYVIKFISSLPKESQMAYHSMLDHASKPGDETLFGREIVDIRNVTFHYPSSGNVSNALSELQDSEGTIAFNGTFVKDFRSLFADEILLEIMKLRLSESDTLKRNLNSLGKWTGWLINFSNYAVCAYLNQYTKHISKD